MEEVCPALELLAAYITSNVTTEEEEQVRLHLERCRDCLEIVSSVIASTIALPDPEPSDEVPE